MFSVEASGFEQQEQDEQNLMKKFIDYIKLRKVVMLDDLAGEFKLNTKDVINRIKALEEIQSLNGVIDERGKYIYITENELQAVANYIKMKGRVSRSDLLFECNNIIKLNPSGKDKNLIDEEDQQILKDAEQEIDQIKSSMKSENQQQ